MSASHDRGAQPPVRQTFADPELQARFEADGYVTVPLLDRAQVDAARAIFAALGDDPSGGFQTDFEMADPQRKEHVHREVTGLLDDELAGLLDRHRGFMASFLAKWPGAGSALYIHQDWAYVDERSHRSVVVWIALDDVSPEAGNGALQVLPGSHRVAGAHRGTRTSAWYEDHPNVVARALVPVAAPAGTAVVMDNALVHASPDNETDQVRLAVAVACIPEESQLIHAVRRDDETVDVLAVDEAFFRAETPSRLRDHVPEDWPVIEQGGPATWQPPDLPLAGRLCGADVTSDVPLGGSEPPDVGGDLLERVAAQALRANHRRIEARACQDGPFLDPAAVAPWLEGLTADWERIAEEYVRCADDRAPAPLATLAGTELPNHGAWRAVVLRDNLGWNADATEACPVTAGHLREVPGLRSAMFSVLGPWARIERHRGSNKGVLRAHLGVIVPEPCDRVTLWAGDRSTSWAPGRSFVFDDTFEHRVANRTPGWRVSLMIEFDRPLRGLDRAVNRSVQRAFHLHPQVRGSAERRRAVREALDA